MTGIVLLHPLGVDHRFWDPVRKAQKPSSAETARNPRARSSTLRSAVRTDVAARVVTYEGLGVPHYRGAA